MIFGNFQNFNITLNCSKLINICQIYLQILNLIQILLNKIIFQKRFSKFKKKFEEWKLLSSLSIYLFLNIKSKFPKKYYFYFKNYFRKISNIKYKYSKVIIMY